MGFVLFNLQEKVCNFNLENKLFIKWFTGSKSKLTGSQTSLDPPEEDWTICTR